MHEIARPYALFLGDASDQGAAVIAEAVNRRRPQDYMGQIRLAGCMVRRYGLPCCDPMRSGIDRIIDAMLDVA